MDMVELHGDGERLDHRLELGRAIRSLRTAQGISTRKFSAMVGISKTTLVNVEGGKANPSLDLLVRIARGLNVSVANLIDF